MSLSRKYTEFLLELCDRIVEETNGKYDPWRFRQMVAGYGGAWTTFRLLTKKESNLGFTKLWALDRLDLTMEAQLVEHEEFHPLFTPGMIEACRRILEDHDYPVPAAGSAVAEDAP